MKCACGRTQKGPKLGVELCGRMRYMHSMAVHVLLFVHTKQSNPGPKLRAEGCVRWIEMCWSQGRCACHAAIVQNHTHVTNNSACARHNGAQHAPSRQS